jgi:hypothetical protein
MLANSDWAGAVRPCVGGCSFEDVRRPRIRLARKKPETIPPAVPPREQIANFGRESTYLHNRFVIADCNLQLSDQLSPTSMRNQAAPQSAGSIPTNRHRPARQSPRQGHGVSPNRFRGRPKPAQRLIATRESSREHRRLVKDNGDGIHNSPSPQVKCSPTAPVPDTSFMTFSVAQALTPGGRLVITRLSVGT